MNVVARVLGLSHVLNHVHQMTKGIEQLFLVYGPRSRVQAHQRRRIMFPGLRNVFAVHRARSCGPLIGAPAGEESGSTNGRLPERERSLVDRVEKVIEGPGTPIFIDRSASHQIHRGCRAVNHIGRRNTETSPKIDNCPGECAPGDSLVNWLDIRERGQRRARNSEQSAKSQKPHDSSLSFQ